MQTSKFRFKNKRGIGVYIKNLAKLGVWVLVVGSIFVFSYLIYLERTLPDPESIAIRRVSESTKIYDKDGETLLYDIHGEEKRTIIPWEEISQNIKDAVIAIEDDNFYSHKGLDVRGIIRAVFRDLRNFELSQGGSTITQQLVKNALLGTEKTFSRKIKELMLSIEIERKFSKDQILWMYLNQIPYGSSIYGIEAASRAFFGKSASELTINESAALASIPKAPTYYSPYGSHVDDLINRKDIVLKRMIDLGYISEEEYRKSVNEEISFKPSTENIFAPHFVVMVKDYLVRKYGEDVVEKGGFKVTTTLDPQLQIIAEEVVKKYSDINKTNYKAGNSALVAIDPKDGGVLTLVGSRDYFDVDNEGNFNVATARRQPGSAFKPFAYATLLEKGYPDSTILFDLKTEFNFNCSPDGFQLKDQYGLDCYHPQDYDGGFRGPVTVRQALSQSLNIPSVKVLYLAGVNETINQAQKMGITTLTDPDRYGLSLVLGGAEVKLVDLVSAYGVFPNEGIVTNWSIIKKIESPDGKILEEREVRRDRVLGVQTARMINNILSDNTSRAPLFGYSSPLFIPGRDVAAKTGTTQENRDAWVVGYSTDLVAGVWSGNNDNASMTAAGAGISASGPMWNEFMRRALAIKGSGFFTGPDPVASNKIMLDGNYSYIRGENLFPELHSLLFFIDKSNPLGDIPQNPQNDPMFYNWEWPVINTYN